MWKRAAVKPLSFFLFYRFLKAGDEAVHIRMSPQLHVFRRDGIFFVADAAHQPRAAVVGAGGGGDGVTSNMQAVKGSV